MNNIISFDLQTKKSFEDVGGKKAIHKMGISVASLFYYERYQIKQFLEQDSESLIFELKNSRYIFGIGLHKFIFKLLKAYSDYDLYSLPRIDLIEYFKRKLRVKNPLEGLFLGTLGFKKKFYNETYCPKLFKSGNINEIRKISKKNVKDLHGLLHFGLKHNFVYFIDPKGLRWKIPVNWHLEK